jgi:hypothetical protein
LVTVAADALRFAVNQLTAACVVRFIRKWRFKHRAVAVEEPVSSLQFDLTSITEVGDG